jgi:hypothetical protein
MEALGQPDPWDTVAYNDTFRRLKYAMKMKRNEAREYAALSIPQEQIKEINKVVGRSFSYNLHRFDVNSAPLWSSSEYLGQGHSLDGIPLDSKIWRTEWDLNARDPCGSATFPG